MAEGTLDVVALGRATLARQLLLEPADLGVVDAVERLAGMQAQEARPPHLGLWTRLHEFSREDLTGALHAREVVRATMYRATLHLMSAADYRQLRPTVQPVLTAAMRVLRDRAAGLELDAVLPAARELLSEPRTFDELRNLLQERFPEVNERALGYAARMHLPLVMVPTDDAWGFPAAARFTLVEGWCGEPVADPGAATGELVRRYLAAFGPATAADFQTWSGLSGAAAAFESLRDELVTFPGPAGRTVFDLPDAPRPGPDVPAPPRFLPDFDNLVLAHQDRSRFIADEFRGRVTTANLRVRATFLHDGRVAGTWVAKRSGRVVTLTMSPFRPLPARAATVLKEAAEPVAAFVEPKATSVEITIE